MKGCGSLFLLSGGSAVANMDFLQENDIIWEIYSKHEGG